MRALLILTLCAGAAACSTPLDSPQSPVFGQAVAAMDAQIIPAVVSDLPPESSGARAVLAIERSDKGEPRPLESQTTSDMHITVVPYANK